MGVHAAMIRKSAVGVAGGLAAALMIASAAWACSPSGSVSVDPGSGPAGSNVQVTGSGFEAPTGGEQPGRVEVRWNTTSGPLLATAEAPSFSTSITIPSNATAKTYYVVAVQRNPDGSMGRQTSTSFTVTAPASQPAPAPSGEPQEPTNNSQPPPQGSEPAANDSQAAPSGPSAGPAPQESAPAPTATQPSGAPPKGAPRPGAAPSPRPASTSAPSGVGAAEAVVVPEAPAQTEPSPAEQNPPADTTVSPDSVSADVWRGFSADVSPSESASLTDTAPADRSDPTVVVGAGLLTIGIAALGVFAVGDLRSRRRARAHQI